MALYEFLKGRSNIINQMRRMRAQMVGKQVFVSHSSADTNLIQMIDTNLKRINVTPFFASLWQVGKPPVPKIVDEIWNSSALFILLTSNVMLERETRDWVCFEIGVARTLENFGLLQIFGWRANNVELTDLFKGVTDFQLFDPYDENSCIQMVSGMINLAQQL